MAVCVFVHVYVHAHAHAHVHVYVRWDGTKGNEMDEREYWNERKMNEKETTNS